ncbi:MAG: capsular biosynthesis protein [Lachnospiraceae bacterium]|nr:capsular biosynthesis protein [Lachnospiraceae bacterium]
MTRGYWDIHNHILPGVDDGSSCMDETMELLGAEYEQGIRNIIFTPHFRPRMFEVPADDREMMYHRTVAEARESFPDMSFYLGCEYFVSNRMMKDVRDPRCRMAGTRIILMEFTTATPFQDILNAVETAVGAGCLAIVAHPERYRCLHSDTYRITCLRSRGAWIQINAGSVIGRGGRMLKHFCRDLLKGDLVDFIASDAHSMDHRPVEMDRCLRFVQKKFGTEKAEQLFEENQRRVFAEAAEQAQTDLISGKKDLKLD